MAKAQIDVNLTFVNLDGVSKINNEQQTSYVEPLLISENKCEKLKSCQHHICDLICHVGECPHCDQLIKQTCLSHGIEREVLCSNETGGIKTFSCGEPCGKLLSCGHHKCTKTCHDGPYPDCLFLPENCNTCACGKTIMDNQQRSSCIDSLPTCEKLCEKISSYGPINDHHQCSAQCHNGPCPPCNKQSIQCHCGQSSKSTAQALSINLNKPPPSTIAYTNFLVSYARRYLQRVRVIEEAFKNLVKLTTRYGHPSHHQNHDDASKLACPILPTHVDEARFIHELASFYSLQ
ncbi:unnamed protein product, partial [Rotaria sordida]